MVGLYDKTGWAAKPVDMSYYDSGRMESLAGSWRAWIRRWRRRHQYRPDGLVLLVLSGWACGARWQMAGLLFCSMGRGSSGAIPADHAERRRVGLLRGFRVTELADFNLRDAGTHCEGDAAGGTAGRFKKCRGMIAGRRCWMVSRNRVSVFGTAYGVQRREISMEGDAS